MSALLRARLPVGFTLAPATGAQVAEVFELRAAEQTAAFGFCPATPEDVRSMLELPDATVSVQHLVRAADGRPVQWWAALRDPGDPITHAWVCTHPQLASTVSDELARVGWAVMLDWVRGRPPRSAATSSCIRDVRLVRNETRGIWPRPGSPASALSGRWSARSPMRAGPHRWCRGLATEASQDVAAIHAVFNEAFVGHYGFTPTSLEDWLTVEQTMAGFDPDLRYLATIDGRPAAAMLLSRRLETEGAMYVGELATLELYRRRGSPRRCSRSRSGSRPEKVWGSWRCTSTARTPTMRPRCTAVRGCGCGQRSGRTRGR